jgi:hypothetical protein
MGGESFDVEARTYHTENGVPHAEGETYPVTDRALLETLRGIGFVSLVGMAAPPPPVTPVLSSLTPSTAVAGSGPLTLQVAGSDFADGDVIHVNGAASPTTFVSATELTTPVDLTAAVAGDVPVSVQSAAGQGSNALTFTVTAAG